MAGREYCSVCRDLLANLGRFLDMLETARKSFTSDWLTVDEVAAEMKLSKSIVYQLIRNGELEAVDLVNASGKSARKGHYRITRSSLNQFLESKKVKQNSTDETQKQPPTEGERSSPMSKSKMMAALRIDSLKTFNAFAKMHGIQQAGNRQTFTIRLDTMDPKTRAKLEKK